MLGARRGTGGLDAVDEASGHASGEDRVLREILEVASAQWGALDVESGPEQDVDAQSTRFEAESLTHLTSEVRIPGGREGGGRRETGRLLGLGDAEVVGVPELSAHAVGAVAHHEGGHVRGGDRARVPGTRSGQESRRL